VAPSSKVFEGTGTGGYGYRLAAVLRSRVFPELGPSQVPFFEDEGSRYYVHFLGAACGSLVADALAADGVEASDVDGKVLVVSGPGPGPRARGLPVPGRGAVAAVVARNLARLEDSLGSGAFFRTLPHDLQVEDHMLALDADGLLAHLAGLEPVLLPAGEVPGRIAAHLSANRPRPGQDGRVEPQ
jgi:hypothetical protein